jgi:ribosomal protein S18 acetylase RimI-like enzyme
MTEQAAIHIRPYRPADRDQVMAIAPRLTEWVASWRDPAAVLPAVQGWVRDSSGQVDAYVGELAVEAGRERRGIASQLMTAAEAWAAARGLSFLTLETGAANQPARDLYRKLGYQEEDVRLTKAIRASAGPRTAREAAAERAAST